MGLVVIELYKKKHLARAGAFWVFKNADIFFSRKIAGDEVVLVESVRAI